MNHKSKKIVIFQEFSTDESTLLNKNLRKVDFSTLTSEDKEFIQDCLENKKIRSYKSKLIQTEISNGYSQVYYLQMNPKRRKIEKFNFSSYNNYNYRFMNKEKSCCKAFTKKCFIFLYNIAKISVLLLIAILTYLLIALSHLKWPKAKDKSKSDCDDNPDGPGCCSCEEIKEKSESMKNRLKDSIKNSEAAASKANIENMMQVGVIGSLLGSPFPEDTRMAEEKELIESMENNTTRISNKLQVFENLHMFGCECQKLKEKYAYFNRYMAGRLRDAFGSRTNVDMKLIDKIKTYNNHLKHEKICETSYGKKLTQYIADITDLVYAEAGRFIS
jgi:hypothetical protein